jgi:flavin-dependent dehydrogenase
MTMRHKDIESEIEIAGAGPAGLSAAIRLAQQGRKVVVHEAAKSVGQRFGNVYQDFQGLENWTTEEDVLGWCERQGLSTDFAALPCRGGLAFDHKDRAYTMSSDEPLFYMVERGPGPNTLDSALLRQAESLGVEVRFNSRLKSIKDKGILAGGPKAADALSVGYHFETDMDDGYWVICDDNLAPQGYAYLLIMKGKGTVKSCMFTDFKNEKQYVEKTVTAFERIVGLRMVNPQFHGGIGNFYIPKSAHQNKHPVIGELAGFQDTLWGFGMRLVISSGLIAADSILQNKNYDVMWRQELKAQMDASVVNRCIFSLLGNRGYSLFLKRQSRRDARQTLYRDYQLTMLKRILLPWAQKKYHSRRGS